MTGVLLRRRDSREHTQRAGRGRAQPGGAVSSHGERPQEKVPC